MSTLSEELEERLLTKSPSDILGSGFTEHDLENLNSIRHELSICVKWGAVAKECMSVLMHMLDTVLFLEEPSKGRVKQNPYDALFPNAKDTINGPNERSKLSREYVHLQLLKKLLGALKTRVNQRLATFEVFDDDTEKQLLNLVWDEDINDEETDSVGKRGSSGREIRAQVTVKDCPHNHTVFKHFAASGNSSGKDELREYCKRCTTWISVKVLNKAQVRKSKRKIGTPIAKKHRCRAAWKPGEEGKIAVCTDSTCRKVIPNPEDFDWTESGLEPFGDNPDSDEVIHIEAQGRNSRVSRAKGASVGGK